MARDDDRRATAPLRRANIISALSREMDPTDSDSAVSRLAALIRDHADEPRYLIVSYDIDGLVSAMMLHQVTGWKIAAVIVKSDTVRVHPDFGDPATLTNGDSRLFGVDVFSVRFPNASNHPVLWGGKRLNGSAAAAALGDEYDARVRESSLLHPVINASLWAGIKGAKPEANADFLGASYRYPLGTAQLLLAALEAIGLSPKVFDRQFLPWLIANCDGGLETIRTYPYNVPMWWSALAAAVGPGSHSEALYQLASQQRPNQFLEVTYALRSENPAIADLLDDNWNMKSGDATDLAPVTRWISQISGWADPFLDGAASLPDWPVTMPDRGSIELRGSPKFDAHVGDDALYLHLVRACHSIHCSFSYYEKNSLGWLMDN